MSDRSWRTIQFMVLVAGLLGGMAYDNVWFWFVAAGIIVIIGAWRGVI